MDSYRIFATDLEEDELSYELAIRGYELDGPIETRYTALRVALRQAEDKNAVAMSHYSLVADSEVVPQKLKEIESQLEVNELKCFSRLVHYHKRVRRYLPETEEQCCHQEALLDVISRMVLKYFGVDLPTAAKHVSVMRVCTIKTQAAAAQTSGGESEVVRGIVHDAPAQVDEDLISFIEDVNPVSRHQGTPKSRTDGGIATGAIPKRSVAGVFSASPFQQNVRSDPIGNPRRQTLPRMVDNIGRGMMASQSTQGVVGGQVIASQSSQGAVGGQVIASSELRNPFSPRIVDDVWETPQLQSKVSSNLMGLKRREETGPPPGHLWNPLVEAANPPAPPAKEKLDRSEFVHISEIEEYVKGYVNQFLAQRSRGAAITQPDVDHLIDRLNRVEVSEPEIHHRSSATEQRQSGRHQTANLDPPLQLPRDIPTSYETRGNNRHPGRNTGMLPPAWGRGEVPNISNPDISFGAMPNFQTRPRLPHQTCNIIEKWPKFSGDTNPVPVVDFLRQIEILSRSYQVTPAELRMHAHLLFKEDAYVWFTAYEGQLNSWETLLTYLKMRYDNPNRDRFIREEMRNRKQKPNELFSAYLTDLEAMSQRMNRKMTSEEKFDIIVENMKLSYKRRLALEPVDSIEHLAQLCYRFDALEANLYTSRTGSKPVMLNAILDDEDSDREIDHTEETCLLALQARNFKKGPANSSTAKGNPGNERKPLLCWNCRNNGHMWRDCSQKKGIFCHICGHPDTTAFRCPENHNLKTRDSSSEGSKNE